MPTPPDAGRELRTRMEQGLRAAQRARDRAGMRVHRDLLAAVDNAGAIDAPQAWDPTSPGVGRTEAPRRILDTAAAAEVLTRELDERRDAAADYHRLGYPTRAQELEADAEVVEGYLRELPGRP